MEANVGLFNESFPPFQRICNPTVSGKSERTGVCLPHRRSLVVDMVDPQQITIVTP